MVYVPAVSVLVEVAATPFDTVTALPTFTPFAVNCTVPVSTGPPDSAGVIVAVKVTLAFTGTLGFEETTTVAVPIVGPLTV